MTRNGSRSAKTRHQNGLPGNGKISVPILAASLRRGGFRITEGRKLLLQILIGAERPLTILELTQRTRSMSAAPDFTTVFRFMVRLEKLGVVRRLSLSRAAAHYQLNDDVNHREHIVCRGCGKITVLREACPVREIEHKIARRYKFTEVTHSLEFFGRCRECTRSKSDAHTEILTG